MRITPVGWKPVNFNRQEADMSLSIWAWKKHLAIAATILILKACVFQMLGNAQQSNTEPGSLQAVPTVLKSVNY